MSDDPQSGCSKSGHEFGAEFGRVLHQQAQQTRSRFCVVLCGNIEWGRESARAMCATYAPESVVQVTDGILLVNKTRVDIKQARQLLGREFDTVVYDCFSGFDADAVGILGGAITAGGLFILVAPPIGQWHEFDDPQYTRVISYGDAKPKSSRYIQRLVKRITKSPHCILVRQHQPLPLLTNQCPSSTASAVDFTDQNNAVAAIKRVISGQRKRPLVLLSDRGRGKSAALGIAAAQLLNTSLKRIAVTGLSKQSTACVFKHAALHTTQLDSLCFIVADKLLATKADIDLLLVDEAASIPIPMLQKLLEMYPRIAFASTVHGYEGTGRGFVLRFKEMLDAHTRGWKSCTLTTPIRWAQDDALESFLFDALLLNAEPESLSMAQVADKTSRAMSLNGLRFNVIERADLIENETLTRDLFGLLTQAHYRTRPADLRHLLDAENLNLFTICHDTTLLGVAVVASEGGFNDEMATKIWANQSRPKGHFLAELLCAQQGLIDAARLNIARIMRIVVNPDLHRRGIGRQLLAGITNFYQGKVDLLGTTFGINLSVLAFWLDSHYLPVRIGHNQSHHTGTHSCTLIKALSEQGHVLTAQATDKFSDHISRQLNGGLSAINPSLVPLIYRGLEESGLEASNTVRLKESELVELVGFAFAHQNMDNIPASLTHLAEQVLKSGLFANDDQSMILLVERVLLGKSWQVCTALPAPSGKQQGIARLRHSVASSLCALYPERVAPIMRRFNLAEPAIDS